MDAVWIETPNNLRCAHVIAAAERGKHVICANPLAATIEECERMIAVCRRNGMRLLQGHSKIFDSPVRAIAQVARSGRLGRVIGVDSWWYNDWLRRPRLASELAESLGAGFILRQAPHLVDIVATIAGSRAKLVRAMTGPWDGAVPTDGNCAALIQFESGAVANLSLNGYGYFGTNEPTWDTGIFGERKAAGKPAARNAPLDEAEKYAGIARECKPGEADNRLLRAWCDAPIAGRDLSLYGRRPRGHRDTALSRARGRVDRTPRCASGKPRRISERRMGQSES